MDQRIAQVVLLNIHLFASILWVGSVYMGTFIDWPAARAAVPKGKFPFEFIVGQGNRVFYSVYIGMFFIWFSAAGLLYLHPPQTTKAIFFLSVKALSLILMTAFTMYGTFSTWRKLQLATDAEAFVHYKFYMYRAMGTFSFGIISSLLGLWIH